MYTQCKYVVLAQEKDEIVKENIYIFPSLVVHKTVAKRMRGKVVGAGFIARDKGTGKLFCRGESDSLQVKSRPEDTILLRSLFL